MHTTTLHTVTGPLSHEAVRGPALAHEHLVLDLDLKGDGGQPSSTRSGTARRSPPNWPLCTRSSDSPSS
ncbi:hypothetical protein [Streptomyces sp. KL116D]|uniref:hypothetical protein n=1 Tax=Streptomyces sp. KL116D TaxID=3045152 RepID=UPI0035577601